MSARRDADAKLLATILRFAEENDLDPDHPVAPTATLAAFERMSLEVSHGFVLSDKQRKWATGVLARLNGEEAPPEYENSISSGRAPRGKEVPTPAILQNLPKKPPRRI